MVVILTLLHPKQHTPLKQWRFEHELLIRVGRAPENDVILEDLLVSRFHLELRPIQAAAMVATVPSWHLTNLSANGTYVNGYLTSQGTISDNDRLQLAQQGPLLQFQVMATAPPLAVPTLPSPQLPMLPKSSLPAIAPRLVPCSHGGNSPQNLFCIHCGQPLRVQQTVRQYQVLRVLGRGGMGTTYLVWNPDITTPTGQLRGELQVLKEMNADMARIPKAQELFEREAAVLKTLNHPGVPRFYDFFVEAGKKYLVMELLHGQDLEKRVRQKGPVAPPQAITWMMQTCEILDYLHNLRPPIIHRDIKPGNLLVQNLNNRIIVLDFGAVKAAGMPSRTRIGAEGYSAPEQTQGRPVVQSDLYAIGTSLIFLLTAESPMKFYEKTAQSYRFALDNIPTITPKLRELIDQTTQLRPGDRYVSARSLAHALQACL